MRRVGQCPFILSIPLEETFKQIRSAENILCRVLLERAKVGKGRATRNESNMSRDDQEFSDRSEIHVCMHAILFSYVVIISASAEPENPAVVL